VYIEKLILNGFGGFKEKQIDFDSPFTVLVGHNQVELQTIEDAICLVLLGISLDKRNNLQEYIVDTRSCSASLILKTETKKRYLLGRDLAQERLEVFVEEGMRLLPQSSTVLMDLLRAELGTLNPLDFEEIFLLKKDRLELNQNSLGIREELQRIVKAYEEGIKEHLFLTMEAAGAIDESENEEENIKEQLEKIDQHLEKLKTKVNEYKDLEDEITEYKEYEVFLSANNKNQIEVLSQQLTAYALDRKYLEEQVKEITKIPTTLAQEKKNLQNKVKAFEELFSPERQKIIENLVKRREERNEALKKLEEEYTYSSGKRGFLARRGRQRGTAEEKMNLLLKELSEQRAEIEDYLYGRSIDKYRTEKAEYEKNKENLTKLQQTPTNVEGREREEELRNILEKEKKIRKELEKLLVLAGTKDIKEIKKKVNSLGTLKTKSKGLEQEITLLSGDYKPLDAIKLMEEKIKELNEALKNKKKATVVKVKAEEEVKMEQNPVLKFYLDTEKHLRKVSNGIIKDFAPKFVDGKYEFHVFYENEWCNIETLSPDWQELFLLTLRISLARLHTPSSQFPFIVTDLLGGTGCQYKQETKDEIRTILENISTDRQVIYLCMQGDEEFITATSGQKHTVISL